MNTNELQQKVARLFQAAGYEVSQAVGLAPGEVDWFATPRAGLSRAKTYFVAWKQCPERLDHALAELERARVARSADKALGVVMDGGLLQSHRTDLGRAAEAITYRRLALEVSGTIYAVRERIQAYEARRGPERYLPRRVDRRDAVEMIKSWTKEPLPRAVALTAADIEECYPVVEQAAYEIGIDFLRDPEAHVPLLDPPPAGADTSLFVDGFAILIRWKNETAFWEDIRGNRRSLACVSKSDIDSYENQAYDRYPPYWELAPVAPEEIERWFEQRLRTPSLYERCRSARQINTEFRALTDAPENLDRFVQSMLDCHHLLPSSVTEWIAHVVARYVGGILSAASAGDGDTTPYDAAALEDAALAEFALGRLNVDVSRLLPKKGDTARQSRTWTRYESRVGRQLNRLIRDYLISCRVIRDIELERFDLLSRHQFPREYVFLFLSILSPGTAAKMTSDRSAEMRAQIEAEVERRLQLTLAHLLKRSVGAIRMNLDAIGEDMPAEQETKRRYELDRIDEELRFLSALAEQTRRWQNVPNGPEEAVALHEIVTAVVAPLVQSHPQVRAEVDFDAELRVRARPAVLRELLHCLVENAFHAALSTRSPRPWVHVAARTEGDTVAVEITDNGPGVHPSDQERIFEPYMTTKKGGGQPLGTGMGLAIARRYAAHIGAQVGLDHSRSDTCFFVRLVAWRNGS